MKWYLYHLIRIESKSANEEVWTFAKAELPKEIRVIQPGQMVTKDLKPDR